MHASWTKSRLKSGVLAIVVACTLPKSGYAASFGGPDTAAAPQISNAILESAEKRLDLWVHNGRDYSATRFSPDTQINRENVGRLKLIWKLKLPRNIFGMETSAIVYDDRIYITDGNRLMRLNPTTGEPLWTWKSKGKKGPNRGAAVLDGRIYMSTWDAHLVCVDADTGALIWEQIVADSSDGHALSAAPLIVKDKVIVGISGSESGVRGFIDAYDAKTGEQAWRFWVVPAPGEPGGDTWEGDSYLHGGGAPWLTGTYDPALNLLYWGTGNPAPDFDGDVRKGANLYTDSIVALNPDTGKLVWYFQNTPHDLFDWGGVSEPILIDEIFDGRAVKAIVQANRNGFVYVLDRTNGKFIAARPFTKISWADFDANGKPVLKPQIAGARVRHVFPGIYGGTNWPPKAYSPRTHMLFIPNIVRGGTYSTERSTYRAGDLYLGGRHVSDDTPAEGSIEAMDIRTGKIMWSFDTRGPNWGGLLATAGGLVFGGAFDGNLRAFNDETGQALWEFQTGTGVYAPPTTFRIAGKQYIGLASGYGMMGNASSGREQQPLDSYYYLFGLAEKQ
jgi:alcohol dehydrogenase (cytochrome c)